MQEQSRYAIGIDVGTTTVRCVVGSVDSANGSVTIVGVGTSPTSGMRKGIVANLGGPARAIDNALAEAERMSGHEVNQATISINGAHIMSSKSDGMIAIGGGDVTEDDVYRVEEVATTGKVPTNREILEIVPYDFHLDGQESIKDPVGMAGTRLEMNAVIISALTPHVDNLKKASEQATVRPNSLIVSPIAAARAVLQEKQVESGVAIVDLGGATTGVAVYEEGDLQHVGVVPIGAINITNDLAIGLKTDPEIAEMVKLKHAVASGHTEGGTVSVKHERQLHTFDLEDIDTIVDARLEEIFERVNKELKIAGKQGQLPSGIVLTGDGAHLSGIAEYAKKQLNLAVRIGRPTEIAGVEDKVRQPEFATAVGLMLLDSEVEPAMQRDDVKHKKAKGAFLQSAGKKMSRLFGRYKA